MKTYPINFRLIGGRLPKSPIVRCLAVIKGKELITQSVVNEEVEVHIVVEAILVVTVVVRGMVGNDCVKGEVIISSSILISGLSFSLITEISSVFP